MTQKDINQLLRQKTQRPVNYRSYGFKEIDVAGMKVSGYLAAFGNVDDAGDVLIKGCFAKSIQEHGPGSKSYRKIAYLYQHESDEPIGRFTMLTEDDFGLYFEAELDEVDTAKDVAIQYQSGTLNQHSIGFRYLWDKIQYDEAMDSFIVKEVELFEGSVVTMGCNENTPFTGFKASQVEEAETKLLEQAEDIIKKVGKSNPSEAYEMRKILSKYIALYGDQPKESLKTKEPQSIDYSKLITHINNK